MNISRDDLKRFYEIGWERKWLPRLNERFIPGDAGYKLRLFETIRMIDFKKDELFHVLDLGCGVGIYAVQILKKFKKARIRCVDISEKNIRAAKDLAESAGIGERATFSVANISEFDTDVKPGVILAAEVLEHLPDPIPAIKNIARMARPDTRIIVSVPNKKHQTTTGWVFYRQLTGKELENIQSERPEDLDRALPRYAFYHKEYEVREIRELLESEGLAVKKIRGCFFQYAADDIPAGFIRWLAMRVNDINRRWYCPVLDNFLGAISGQGSYETIILDCRIKSNDNTFCQ